MVTGSGRSFPHELVPKLAELNIAGFQINGCGCPGMSNVTAGLVILELGRGDLSMATFAGVHSALAMMSIALCGSEEQKQRFLPEMARLEKVGAFGLTEPYHGTDVVALDTTVRRDGDSYVLNGHKRWIGNATFADYVIIWARGEDHHVNGWAIGGGTEMALACDLVVAGANAVFGLFEVTHGLVPPEGGIVRLTERVPRNVALELLLTGDRLAAPRAAELGLVNHVTEPGAALTEARRLAPGSPRTRRSRWPRSSARWMNEPRSATGRPSRSRTESSRRCSPRRTPRRAPVPLPRSANGTGRAGRPEARHGN
jgi:hypothetical protein